MRRLDAHCFAGTLTKLLEVTERLPSLAVFPSPHDRLNQGVQLQECLFAKQVGGYVQAVF